MDVKKEAIEFLQSVLGKRTIKDERTTVKRVRLGTTEKDSIEIPTSDFKYEKYFDELKVLCRNFNYNYDNTIEYLKERKKFPHIWICHSNKCLNQPNFNCYYEHNRIIADNFGRAVFNLLKDNLTSDRLLNFTNDLTNYIDKFSLNYSIVLYYLIVVKDNFYTKICDYNCDYYYCHSLHTIKTYDTEVFTLFIKYNQENLYKIRRILTCIRTEL